MLTSVAKLASLTLFVVTAKLWETMRVPRRKRPPARRLATRSTNRELLRELAARVTYVGSPEHKDMPSFAGHPRPRADASLCPRELTRNHATVLEWLREAFRRGAVSERCEGDFPRFVWFEQAGVVYKGRLVNRVLGEYKGYPLEAGEGPRGIEALYD